MRTAVFVPLTGLITHSEGIHSTQQEEAHTSVILHLLFTSGLPPEFGMVCNGLCMYRFYVPLRHSLQVPLPVLSVLCSCHSRVQLSFIFPVCLQKLLQDLVSKCSPCLVTTFALVSLYLFVDSGRLRQSFISHWMEPALVHYSGA